jgi:pseudouridine-5'-monophosphatase
VKEIEINQNTSHKMSKIYPMTIKAAIFDNDGTLMDTEFIYNLSHTEIVGHEIDWDIKAQIFGISHYEICKKLKETFNLNDSLESIMKRSDEILDKHWLEVKLFPDAYEFIKEIKKRISKIGLVT